MADKATKKRIREYFLFLGMLYIFLCSSQTKVSSQPFKTFFLSKASQWYTVDVPEFKKHPHFFHPCPALYLIGDAAAQIAPASGDGLAMALAGGKYAAHFALNKETRLYQKFLKKSFQQRVKWAKKIHNLHLSPFKSKLALSTCQSFPAIFQRLFTLTRGGM